MKCSNHSCCITCTFTSYCTYNIIYTYSCNLGGNEAQDYVAEEVAADETWTGFKLVGDNLDKNVVPRYPTVTSGSSLPLSISFTTMLSEIVLI